MTVPPTHATSSMEKPPFTDNGESICPICAKPNQGHVNVTCKKCKSQTHYHCSGLSKNKGQGNNFICFICNTSMGPPTSSHVKSSTQHSNEPRLTDKSPPDQQTTNLRSTGLQSTDLELNDPRLTEVQSHNKPVTSDIKVAISKMSIELEKLKQSQQVVVDSLSSFGTQLTSISKMSQILEDHGKRVESLEDKNDRLQHHVDVIDRKMDELDQKSRGHNVQIDGIPQTNNENLRDIMMKLATTLKVPLTSDDITHVTRVHSTNAIKCKPIICCINKYNLPSELIKASRKLKPNTNSIGMLNDKVDIFINEHLTVARKQLMYKAKQFKKANNYEFLWIKNGNIFLKKAKDTKAINVNVSTDFSRLI